MASIAGAIERIKRDPRAMLNRGMIETICNELNYEWRDGKLDPATTVALFVQQVLQNNAPCSEVVHMGQDRFTASAYCQARRRLPLALCQALLTQVCDAALPQTRETPHLFHGHRVFLVDGSTVSMPDTPELVKAFGVPSGPQPGCAFPVAHLLVLFSAQTGLLLDAWASPMRTSDLSQIREAHLHLDDGDVMLGDDSFSGYAHLALLSQANLHGLVPVHHMRIVDFTCDRPHTAPGNKAVAGMPRSRWIQSLGKEDQLVEFFKPKQTPLWMSRQDYDQLPDSIIVREIRRTVCRPGLGKVTLTLATTLLDPKAYPAEELVELKLRRWDVETNLRHLKTTMNMDVLRCRTEMGVRKELAIFCLTYNLIRMVMMEAAKRQEVSVARISFADAYKWMRHAREGAALKKLMLVPYRPNRSEPRCKKRRAKQYDLMNKPRDVLRKKLENKRRAA